MEVTNIIMLYEWAETLDVRKRAHPLISIQRTGALHIASASRTLSTPTVLLISGTIRVDLLASEQTDIYKPKSAGNYITGHFRVNPVSKWQRGWNNEDSGRWTAELIPDIRPWNDRKFREVKYFFILENTDILRNICTE